MSTGDKRIMRESSSDSERGTTKRVAPGGGRVMMRAHTVNNVRMSSMSHLSIPVDDGGAQSHTLNPELEAAVEALKREKKSRSESVVVTGETPTEEHEAPRPTTPISPKKENESGSGSGSGSGSVAAVDSIDLTIEAEKDPSPRAPPKIPRPWARRSAFQDLSSRDSPPPSRSTPAFAHDSTPRPSRSFLGSSPLHDEQPALDSGPPDTYSDAGSDPESTLFVTGNTPPRDTRPNRPRRDEPPATNGPAPAPATKTSHAASTSASAALPAPSGLLPSFLKPRLPASASATRPASSSAARSPSEGGSSVVSLSAADYDEQRRALLSRIDKLSRRTESEKRATTADLLAISDIQKRIDTPRAVETEIVDLTREVEWREKVYLDTVDAGMRIKCERDEWEERLVRHRAETEVKDEEEEAGGEE